MKDTIREIMFVDGSLYIGTLQREVVQICGVYFKFYEVDFDEASGKSTIIVHNTKPHEFSEGKGRFLRKKVQQYIEWTGRQNTRNLERGMNVPPVRKKWY